MQEKSLDRFEDLSQWSGITSGQAELKISRDRGRAGNAMRMDFDFHEAGGFVVARRELSLELPETYSFGFLIRGKAPRNILEFKLLDETNRNVWRYREEDFKFPEDWRDFRVRSSQIVFAWGPIGGGPIRHAAAVEIVVAAGPGGAGTVWLEDLRLRDETYRLTPSIKASSALPGHPPEAALEFSRASNWRSEPSDQPQWLSIDFRQEREYGGLVIHWVKAFRARHFDIQVSMDGLGWRTAYATDQADWERSYIFLPDTVSRHMRINLYEGVKGRAFGIRGVEVKPYEFSRSVNHFFQAVAREHPAGLYPKYLQATQTYWTPVGTGEGEAQALFNEEGMVEVDKGAFSIAPFLFADGRLITWADAAIGQTLENAYLPIPSSRWTTGSLAMKVTAFASDQGGRSVLTLRYQIENLADEPQRAVFFAAVLPFQVTPTWQNWRAFGGVSPIRELTYRKGELLVNGRKRVIPLRKGGGFGAASFAEGGVAKSLLRGVRPRRSHVKDDFGYASGAFRYDLELASRTTQEVALAIPFGDAENGTPLGPSARGPGVSSLLERAVGEWESRLAGVRILLPPGAQEVFDTFRTAAAHILINREGPALHPGPRRYTRSWIRDGAVMGAALLRLGRADPMRDFIRWYKDYQRESGEIPDCVDREEVEWLPEFDAYGQFIYAVMEYYRFTKERAFLEEMRPAVRKALAFMEGLRETRMSADYLEGEKRVFYGLLPESMSHEGYMAHPVHAYWDDFWALRGMADASEMAEALGDHREAERLALLRDGFSSILRSSLETTISRNRIDFLPGSVEFADFDPAATAVAIGLLDHLPLLPPAETQNTFDKFLSGFRERSGTDWNNYSAYEIRIIGALVKLGRRQEALELLAFMLADRRIPPWNQWPEISWRDPAGPSFIGDLPHSWIGAEYILAVRNLFAYEREVDETMVLAAGADLEWMKDGFRVGVENLPTYHGRISYRMWLEGAGTLRLTLGGDFIPPPGGIEVRPPLPGIILRVVVNGEAVREFDGGRFTCRACPAEVAVTYQR